MGWSGNRTLVFVLLLVPALLHAQARPGQQVPAEFEEQIAARVGQMWDVSPEAIRLFWGAFSGADDLSSETPFRLLGNGTDGWFAVLVERENERPVAARVRAGRMAAVPVAQRSLRAGHTLTDADIVIGSTLDWGPPGPAAEMQVSPGWKVSRSVREGDPLTPPRVEPPLLVEAGDRVQLTWSGERIRIAVEGRALNGASFGGEVRVLLDGNRGKARGIVTGEGIAELTGRTK